MGSFLFRFRLAALLGSLAALLFSALTQKHWSDQSAWWGLPISRWFVNEGRTAVVVVTGLLCVVAFLLRTAAEARLRHIVYGQIASEKVVKDGPFAWTRNPLYIGMGLFFCAATALWVPSGLWFISMLLFFGALHFIVIHEERSLSESLGDPYRAYIDQVPRWFPRIPPRESDEDGRSSGRSYGWAALGNIGLLSLGLFRLAVAAGGPVKPLGWINITVIAIWIVTLIARRSVSR